MEPLEFFPGQLATILLEVKNSDGYRTNSSIEPIIDKIYAFTNADGYSILDGYFKTDGYQNPLIKIDTGLYYVKQILPKGSSSLGSYLVEILYENPDTGFPAIKTYIIQINAPYGNFSVVTSI